MIIIEYWSHLNSVQRCFICKSFHYKLVYCWEPIFVVKRTLFFMKCLNKHILLSISSFSLSCFLSSPEITMKILKTLNGKGIFKNDSIWFPVYYCFNTMWNYSDASLKLAKVPNTWIVLCNFFLPCVIFVLCYFCPLLFLPCVIISYLCYFDPGYFCPLLFWPWLFLPFVIFVHIIFPVLFLPFSHVMQTICPCLEFINTWLSFHEKKSKRNISLS